MLSFCEFMEHIYNYNNEGSKFFGFMNLNKNPLNVTKDFAV